MAEPGSVEAPSWRRGLDELWIGWRVMADVGLAVVGSGLVGLAAAVLLSGFGIVGPETELSTAGMLASVLVIGVLGAFALGVASEGGLGTAPPPVRRRWRVGALAVGGSVVSAVFLGIVRLLDGSVAGLPFPFAMALEAVRAAGPAGFAVSLLVVPALWAVQEYADGAGVLAEVELHLVYTVWVILLLVTYRLPVT